VWKGARKSSGRGDFQVGGERCGRRNDWTIENGSREDREWRMVVERIGRGEW
jgi:hypothetical protein